MMVLAPTSLGKGSTRAWGLMPSSWVGFDAFEETHKQKDSTGFQVESLYALPDKELTPLTILGKGLRAVCCGSQQNITMKHQFNMEEA